MSITHLEDLREAVNAIRVPGSLGPQVHAALHKASLTLQNWSDRHEPLVSGQSLSPAHQVIEASLDVLQAFIDWADGDGTKYKQVVEPHLAMCRGMLVQLGTSLTQAGLGPDRVKPERYNQDLRRLAIFAGGIPPGRFDIDERYAQPLDKDEALAFMQDHWPVVLHDLVKAIGAKDSPRDLPGAPMAHRFARLSAILNADGILVAAQAK